MAQPGSAQHVWGQPYTKGAATWCPKLLRGLEALVEGGFGPPPLRAARVGDPGTALLLRVGELADAAAAGRLHSDACRLSSAAAIQVIRARAPLHIQCITVTPHPRGAGGAPDRLLVFTPDDRGDEARELVFAGDAAEVCLEGRQYQVRKQLVPPPCHAWGGVIVKLYTAGAAWHWERAGLGALVLGAFGCGPLGELGGCVLAEWMGSVEGEPDVRQGGTIVLQVRPPARDPELRSLPHHIDLGDGGRIRVSVHLPRGGRRGAGAPAPRAAPAPPVPPPRHEPSGDAVAAPPGAPALPRQRQRQPQQPGQQLQPLQASQQRQPSQQRRGGGALSVPRGTPAPRAQAGRRARLGDTGSAPSGGPAQPRPPPQPLQVPQPRQPPPGGVLPTPGAEPSPTAPVRRRAGAGDAAPAPPSGQAQQHLPGTAPPAPCAARSTPVPAQRQASLAGAASAPPRAPPQQQQRPQRQQQRPLQHQQPRQEQQPHQRHRGAALPASGAAPSPAAPPRQSAPAGGPARRQPRAPAPAEQPRRCGAGRPRSPAAAEQQPAPPAAPPVEVEGRRHSQRLAQRSGTAPDSRGPSGGLAASQPVTAAAPQQPRRRRGRPPARRMLVDGGPPSELQGAAGVAPPPPSDPPLEIPDEQRCLAHLEDEHPYCELTRLQRLEVVRAAYAEAGAARWVRMRMPQTRALLEAVAARRHPTLGPASWRVVGPKRGRRSRSPGPPEDSPSSRGSPSTSPPPGRCDRRRSARKRRPAAEYWVSALLPAGGSGGQP